jgi:hypothetical protein
VRTIVCCERTGDKKEGEGGGAKEGALPVRILCAAACAYARTHCVSHSLIDEQV